MIDLSAPRTDQAAGILGAAIRRHILVGWVGSGAMIAALAAMATMVDFAGAIIAPGHVVVDSSVKKVQPAATGTIVAIQVKDGDRVRVGDLLIQLDAKTAEANLEDFTQQIDALRARQARLKAETTGAAAIAFPPDLLGRRDVPEMDQLIVSENEEFTSRRAASEGQKEQLRQKISELQQQLVGDKAQEDATR